MKRPKIYTMLMLLVLIIALNSVSFSQTKSSNIVTTDETISFLLKENKESKNSIAAAENRIADLESELIVERENSASISKSYETAQSEITSLKSSNTALARAVAINEDTIAKLQTDNAKQRGKVKNANKTKWSLIAGVVGLIALKFILP